MYVKKGLHDFFTWIALPSQNDRTLIFFIIKSERDHFRLLSYLKYIIFTCHETSVMFVSTVNKTIKFQQHLNILILTNQNFPNPIFHFRFSMAFTAKPITVRRIQLKNLSRIMPNRFPTWMTCSFLYFSTTTIRSFSIIDKRICSTVHKIFLNFFMSKKINSSRVHYHYDNPKFWLHFPVSLSRVLISFHHHNHHLYIYLQLCYVAILNPKRLDVNQILSLFVPT